METGWTGAVRIITRNGTEILLNEADIQPIPLSPEILTKNGFTLTKSGDFYKLIDSNYDWSVEISNNDNRIGYVSGDGNVTKRFNYVHELQHALRLCGLTDLADNFKVE